MNQICPEDFQALPVTIINSRKDTEYFEIKDFYAINLLKCIYAIDWQESIIEWSENSIADVKRLRYLEDPWQNGAIRLLAQQQDQESRYQHFTLDKPCKLAIDVVTGTRLWHPELDRELPRDSYHFFMQDRELYILGGYDHPPRFQKSPGMFGKLKKLITGKY